MEQDETYVEPVEVEPDELGPQTNQEVCPVCGSPLQIISRCKTCPVCFWGTCGL